MQNVSVQIIRGYFEQDFNCGVIEYTVTTDRDTIDCIEYVDDGYYGQFVCENGDSWLSISFPWESAFDDSERPFLMPAKDYCWEECRHIRDVLENWLENNPITFPDN